MTEVLGIGEIQAAITWPVAVESLRDTLMELARRQVRPRNPSRHGADSELAQLQCLCAAGVDPQYAGRAGGIEAFATIAASHTELPFALSCPTGRG